MKILYRHPGYVYNHASSNDMCYNTKKPGMCKWPAGCNLNIWYIN